MADAALLSSIESSLRTFLGDTTGKFVGIQPGGQPPPVAGQHYVGIDGCDISQADTEGSTKIDETFGVTVTVTFRYAYVPRDRQGAQMLLTGELRALARSIAIQQHMNYAVLNAANAVLTSAVNGFVEPLRYLSMTKPQEKPASWLYAEDSDNPPTIYAIDITLGGARRVQTLESMT